MHTGVTSQFAKLHPVQPALAGPDDASGSKVVVWQQAARPNDSQSASVKTPMLGHAAQCALLVNPPIDDAAAEHPLPLLC